MTRSRKNEESTPAGSNDLLYLAGVDKYCHVEQIALPDFLSLALLIGPLISLCGFLQASGGLMDNYMSLTVPVQIQSSF